MTTLIFETFKETQMRPSEKCKAAGLKSLAELAEISGESVQTLNNWSKKKPVVFDLVLQGAVAKKQAAVFDS